MKKIYTADETQNIAEITAFLYAGAIQHPTLGQKGNGVCLDDWGGHSGFVYCCASYAAEIEKWLGARLDSHPGVMLYELIEPMGEWLLEKFATPPDADLVLEYFKTEYLAWINEGD